MSDNLVSEPIPKPYSDADGVQHGPAPTSADREFGRLTDLSIWAAQVQGRATATSFSRVRLVVIAGDHPMAEPDTSAHPAGWGRSRAQLIDDGSAVVRQVAQAADVGVTVLQSEDGNGRIDVEDALDEARTLSAFRAGMAVADGEVDARGRPVLLGDVGRNSTAVASVLISVLTATEPLKTLATGSTTDDAAWMHRMTAVRDARRRAWPYRHNPLDLLRVAGGSDFALMAGLLYRAAVRRTPVVLDGVVGAAVGLVIARLDPEVTSWLRAGHRAVDNGHDLALRRLGLQPVLDLGLATGEGLGAVLAYGVLKAAVCLPEAPDGT